MESQKGPEQPCHVEIWRALGELDIAVANLQEFARELVDEKDPRSDAAEPETAPSFASVIEDGANRIHTAKAKLNDVTAELRAIVLAGRRNGRGLVTGVGPKAAP